MLLIPEWKNSLAIDRHGSTSICIHLMVRDEAPRMARVLRSLIRLEPTEVLVADTGSKDETVSIAEYFGCRVIHIPWNDDFSHARNQMIEHSAEHSSAKWIMWIDGDEELDEHGADVLRRLIMTEQLNADYHVVRFSDPPISMFQCRIWRNKKDVVWRGRVHEKIVMGRDFERHSNILIMQYPDERRMDKHRRNLRLLDMSIQENPSDTNNYFHAAILNHMIGNNQNAKLYAEKYLMMAPREDLKTRSYMLYLLAYLSTYVDRNYQHAVNLLATALSFDPCAAELWCLMGAVYWWIGRLSDAYTMYQNAIELGKYQDDILWLVDLDKYDRYPRERIKELESKNVGPPMMAVQANGVYGL